MKSARSTRDLRDPRGPSVACEASLPRGRRRALARDASEFLGLLAKTFSSLPGDVIAASIVINLLGLALPLAILQVYDRVIPHAATSTLLFLILGVCLALVLEGVLRITRSQVIAWGAMKEAWKTNVDAASRVALAPARLVDREPPARWMQRFQAVGTTADFQLSPLLLVLVDLPFMLIFLALLFAISGLLATIPLLLFLLFGIGAIGRGRELRAATVDRAIAEAKIRDFLVEALNGIVTVKAVAMEQQVLRRFERLAEQASGSTYNLVRLSDDAQSFGSLVSTLTQMTTATVGAVLAINGEISIGALACCTMLSGARDTAASAPRLRMERDPGGDGGHGRRQSPFSSCLRISVSRQRSKQVNRSLRGSHSTTLRLRTRAKRFRCSWLRTFGSIRGKSSPLRGLMALASRQPRGSRWGS